MRSAVAVCLVAMACSRSTDDAVQTMRALGPPSRAKAPLPAFGCGGALPFARPLYVFPDRNRHPDAPVRDPDVRPVRISSEQPAYPAVARKARISGIVIVEMIIERDGHVSDVRVLKPLPVGLDQAAVDAARTWKYKPGMINGRPVRTLWMATVRFPPG